MSLDEMVAASAANLQYYHPFKKDGNLYISGDNMAKVPAMFSILNVLE